MTYNTALQYKLLDTHFWIPITDVGHPNLYAEPEANEVEQKMGVDFCVVYYDSFSDCQAGSQFPKQLPNFGKGVMTLRVYAFHLVYVDVITRTTFHLQVRNRCETDDQVKTGPESAPGRNRPRNLDK